MRVLLGAFGDPGHAFPVLALGTRLVERGHAVAVQTWERWRAPAEAAGMAFLRAPEYPVWPGEDALTPYDAAVQATRDSLAEVRDWRPDVVVADVLTLAPALAGELCGAPVATLVPHVFPWAAPGHPPFSLGARAPRTRAGARVWRAVHERVVTRALDQGRDEYNAARAALGLAPRGGHHTSLSRSLTLVATLPHLEYPRRWPRWARVCGPLLWEPPGGAAVAPPPGAGPVVLVAPSTAQDPEQALLRAALAGLADAPVRVIAVATERRGAPLPAPANAAIVPWASYAATMPACDAVVLHGGHGTLARALASGCVAVVCPAAGDMAENAARTAWAGAGVRLPRRWLAPRTVRIAVERALADERLRVRADAIAAWARAHDGATLAARELEAWAARVVVRRP